MLRLFRKHFIKKQPKKPLGGVKMESKNSQLEKTEKNRTKILKKLLGSKIVWGVVGFVFICILFYNF